MLRMCHVPLVKYYNDSCVKQPKNNVINGLTTTILVQGHALIINDILAILHKFLAKKILEIQKYKAEEDWVRILLE